MWALSPPKTAETFWGFTEVTIYVLWRTLCFFTTSVSSSRPEPVRTVAVCLGRVVVTTINRRRRDPVRNVPPTVRSVDGKGAERFIHK